MSRPLIDRHVAVRLLLALLLSCSLSTLVGAWSYYTTNQKAADTQQSIAREHYAKVIADLERRWGREAFNLKIRIEAQRFLEDTKQQKEQLLAYLTSQGGSIEFPSLRIDNARGHTIATFEYASDKIPTVSMLPGQESTWAFDPTNGRLYQVFRQLIWLGNENGYLLLFRPMDHAMLAQNSYPHTRLSLWWKGKPIASSEGDDGLPAASLALEQSGQTQLLLPWSATNNDNAPKLFIESISPPLLSSGELAVPLAISLLTFAITAWAILDAQGRQQRNDKSQ